MSGKIMIGDTCIPFEERKSVRSTRITLRVTPERVRISAPAKATKREIQAFIEVNRQWILDNWLKLQQTVAQIERREYCDGSQIQYIGNKVALEIVETTGLEIRASHNQEKQVLKIALPLGLSTERRQELILEILEKWYKVKARALFQKKLDFWSERMSVHYNQFRLKEQKTRWGSCSSLGNINLNWRAVMAPETVIDYLVIHELAHLKHMDHSAAFWAFVSEFCRDHHKHRHWLRVQGKNLRL